MATGLSKSIKLYYNKSYNKWNYKKIEHLNVWGVGINKKSSSRNDWWFYQLICKMSKMNAIKNYNFNPKK